MATEDVPTYPPWRPGAGLPIAEVVERTGLSRDTLRYYEKAGLIDAVDRSSGGQRRYASADLAWLEFLLRLRATGMSIADMQRFAELRRGGDRTIADRLTLLWEHRIGVEWPCQPNLAPQGRVKLAPPDGPRHRTTRGR